MTLNRQQPSDLTIPRPPSTALARSNWSKGKLDYRHSNNSSTGHATNPASMRQPRDPSRIANKNLAPKQRQNHRRAPRTPDSNGSECPGRRIRALWTQIKPESRPTWPDPARPWQAQIWAHKPRSRHHTPTLGDPAVGGPSSTAREHSTLQPPTTQSSTAGVALDRAGTGAPHRDKGETRPIGPSRNTVGGETAATSTSRAFPGGGGKGGGRGGGDGGVPVALRGEQRERDSNRAFCMACNIAKLGL
nr:uncharacterized protein LOC127339855 [Lolium perenne]